MNIVRALLTLILILGTSGSWTQEGGAIGEVVAVEGDVRAEGRLLNSGSPIFVTDEIDVAEGGRAEIRFTDGSLLSLIESTKYRIDSYRFDRSGKSEYAGELVVGGFRTISGMIGKQDPEEYAVKTPVATIGIRGTLFAVNILEAETFFGVDEGSIAITNNAGTIDLEEGQFATYTSPDILGTVTEVRPEALGAEIFAVPYGAEPIEAGAIEEVPIEIEPAAGENPEVPQGQEPEEAPAAGEQPPPEGELEEQLLRK